MNRRDFLGSLAAGITLAACDSTGPNDGRLALATIDARPHPPTAGISHGWQGLGLGTGRDGLLYVPPNYTPATQAPLGVFLHGAGRSSEEWREGGISTLADQYGLVLLCPDSRAATWDRIQFGEFRVDVDYIDDALAQTFNTCNIDPARISLGGFSDGASYALSLGAANGDLFSALLGFSPGFFLPPGHRGKPRVFVSHGFSDNVLPYLNTSQSIVPALRKAGLTVQFESFPGGHWVPEVIGEMAFEWLVG